MLPNYTNPLYGAFDGKNINSGLTDAEIANIQNENSRTLYVSSLAQLPSAGQNGYDTDEIYLGDIDLGKNIVRFTNFIDLADKVLVIDGVTLSSNMGGGTGFKTNNPLKPLIRNVVGTSVNVNNLVLSNDNGVTGVGDIFSFNGGAGAFQGAVCTLVKNSILYAKNIGKAVNYTLFDIEGMSIFSIVDNGFTIGDATTFGAVITYIQSLFMQTLPVNPGGYLFKFDTTLPGSQSITANTLSLLMNDSTGIQITNKANMGSFSLFHSGFSGPPPFTPLSGFTPSDPGVFISEDCIGVDYTPTDYQADYKDTATQAAPISVPFNTPTKLTCDGLGGGTKNLPATITKLWDTATNKLYVADVPLNRALTVVVDLSINTNQFDTAIALEVKGLDPAVSRFYGDTINLNEKNQYIRAVKEITIDITSQDFKQSGAELEVTLIAPAIATALVKVNSIRIKRG